MTNGITRIRSQAEEMAAKPQPSRLGLWYWVDGEGWDHKPHRWFGCVVHEGSNYVQVRGPSKHGNYDTRIHLDEFDDYLTFEPNHEQVIADKIEAHRQRMEELMRNVQGIVGSLGIQPKAVPYLTGSTALTAPTGKVEIKKYEKALVTAQNETLPKIYEEMKDNNKAMAAWMSASILPMEAQLRTAMGMVGHIKSRIYAISLYAGLTEEVEQVAEGKPAPADERVRLFQRRLYMDEECLADYRSGGMEFKDIHKFEAWLCKPKNLNRMLPSPRCIVSMRVRRSEKERGESSLLSIFINIKLAEYDKATFLYIRNGDNVYRLGTDLDFGASLFPDRSTFDPMRPMMAKMFGSRVDSLISKDEYDALAAAEEERKRNSKKWEKDNPKSTWKDKRDWHWSNPFREQSRFEHDRYEPFDPSSVYYDDISEEVAEKIAHYNRVALIVQGMFDRSPVFQPHTMPKTWRPDDFMRAVELVYDNSAVLDHGEAPDFEAYRTQVNASLAEGSVVIGQEYQWMKREAAKYNSQGSRFRGSFHPVKLHRPYGDDGPGFASEIATWNRKARTAVFRWTRQRQGRRSWMHDSNTLPSTITVPADKLFNVSAYKPGDYKRFLADHRTRAQYIKWAPFLLGAEDWHASRHHAPPGCT